MTLNTISLIADILSKTVTALAAIVAGIWAYRRFVVGRHGVWSLRMELAPEVIPYRDELRVLLIRIKLINDGKIRIRPGSRGCEVMMTRLPFDVPAGGKLTTTRGEVVMPPEDVLQRYRLDGSRVQYEIEPGSEYHELAELVVTKGDLILVQCTFWWETNNDKVTEFDVVRID